MSGVTTCYGVPMNQSQEIQEALSFKSRHADNEDLTPAFRKKLASMERKAGSKQDLDRIGNIAVTATWDFGIFEWSGDGRYPRANALKVFSASGDQRAEKKAMKEAEKRSDKGDNVVARSIPT